MEHRKMISPRIEGIWALQSALVSKGQSIVIDGDLGPKTVEALKAFQKSAGIAETGTLDGKTLGSLGLDQRALAGLAENVAA